LHWLSPKGELFTGVGLLAHGQLPDRRLFGN
jgi:hypothetical protein